MAFTFSTAAAISSAIASKAVVFTPVVVRISVLAWVLIKARSTVSVRSRDLSAALAFGSVNFAAFVFTTSTTDFRAAENASTSLAPAPSAEPENALTTLMICWLAFSTANASAVLTPAANGLKVSGSTPFGRPRTVAT